MYFHLFHVYFCKKLHYKIYLQRASILGRLSLNIMGITQTIASLIVKHPVFFNTSNISIEPFWLNIACPVRPSWNKKMFNINHIFLFNCMYLWKKEMFYISKGFQSLYYISWPYICWNGWHIDLRSVIIIWIRDKRVMLSSEWNSYYRFTSFRTCSLNWFPAYLKNKKYKILF